MRQQQIISVFSWLAVVFFAATVGCINAQQVQKPTMDDKKVAEANPLPLLPKYTFQGRVYSKRGGDAPYIHITVLGDTSIVYATDTDLGGRYKFTLPDKRVSLIKRFMIHTQDYDTLIQEFDRSQLSNSIIQNDFLVVLNPTLIQTPIIHVARHFSQPDSVRFKSDSLRLNKDQSQSPMKPIEK